MYKIVYNKSNIPVIFSQTIQLASIRHLYNTRFADKQNFSRPKVQTNCGIHTFNFVSSQIWQSIYPEIKLSNSVDIFREKYIQSLLLS